MIDLMSKKFYFFGLSLVIILAGIIAYFAFGGFKLGIQFSGGTIISMQTKDDSIDTKKAEDVAKSAIGKDVIVQKTKTLNASDSSKNYYMLVINVASKDTLSAAETNKLVDTMRKEFSTQIGAKGEMSTTNIQPSFGKETFKNGLMAVAVSSILIIFYLWWRFNVMSGLSAGVTAVVALLHDVLLMLAVYVIFRIQLNEAFIAAVLTVIGYSMNDTIIIYDRIRENSSQIRKTAIAELVNKSIIQTLSRSINTVVTVLICIITVYIFAAYSNIQSIKEFTEPLIIGIASGCYSSIFIASPLWVLWKEYQNKKKVSARKPARA